MAQQFGQTQRKGKGRGSATDGRPFRCDAWDDTLDRCKYHYNTVGGFQSEYDLSSHKKSVHQGFKHFEAGSKDKRHIGKTATWNYDKGKREWSSTRPGNLLVLSDGPPASIAGPASGKGNASSMSSARGTGTTQAMTPGYCPPSQELQRFASTNMPSPRNFLVKPSSSGYPSTSSATVDATRDAQVGKYEMVVKAKICHNWDLVQKRCKLYHSFSNTNGGEYVIKKDADFHVRSIHRGHFTFLKLVHKVGSPE